MKLKVVTIIILVIVFINIMGYVLFSDGVIIKVKPLKYAMMFAHGSYGYYLNNTIIAHTTTINSHRVYTQLLLDNLHEEGYETVWLSQCHTGDHEFMIYDTTTNKGIRWYPWVSRNTKPGITVPIFVGFEVVRLSI